MDNFNQGTNVDSAVLFAKTSVRKKLIASLMEEVQNLGLDGLNLDIEWGSSPQRARSMSSLSGNCLWHVGKQGLFYLWITMCPEPYNLSITGQNRAGWLIITSLWRMMSITQVERLVLFLQFLMWKMELQIL